MQRGSRSGSCRSLCKPPRSAATCIGNLLGAQRQLAHSVQLEKVRVRVRVSQLVLSVQLEKV